MAKTILIFDRQDHKKPTPGQLSYIGLVESRVGVEFTGSTFEDAAQFIDTNVQANPDLFYLEQGNKATRSNALLRLADEYGTANKRRKQVIASEASPLLTLHFGTPVHLSIAHTMLQEMYNQRNLDDTDFYAEDPQDYYDVH